jgi:hypothetical protein
MILLKEFIDSVPSSLQLFPFKDDWPLHESDKFKSVSIDFVNGVNTAIVNLNEEDKLITFLRTKGKNFADRAKI